MESKTPPISVLIFACADSRGRLPARFARLTRMAAVVVASPATGALAAWAAAALCFRPRLVHVQGAPAQLFAVERRNGFLSFSGIRHFDECKSSRTAGVAIGHNANLLDCAMRFEQGPQLCFAGTVRDVANKKLLHRIFPRLQAKVKLRFKPVSQSAVLLRQTRTSAGVFPRPLLSPDADPSGCAWQRSARTPPESPSGAAVPRRRLRTLRLRFLPRRRGHSGRPPGCHCRERESRPDTRACPPEKPPSAAAWRFLSRHRIPARWWRRFAHPLEPARTNRPAIANAPR